MDRRRGRIVAIAAGAAVLAVTATLWVLRDELVAWWVGYRFVWLGRDVYPRGGPGEAGEVAVTVRDPEDAPVGGVRRGARPDRAGVWRPKTGVEVISDPPLDSMTSRSSGMNRLGHVVGTVDRGGHYLGGGFLWTPGEGVRLIEGLGGRQTAPADVNDHGEVVGWSHPPGGGSRRAFLWTAAGGAVDLGSLARGSESLAVAIDERGWVVGGAVAADGRQHPFLWTLRAGMRDLGLPAGFTHGLARDLNARGEVIVDLLRQGPTVGNATLVLGTPYVWTEEGGMRPLPAPSGHDDVRAVAINARGDVLLQATDLPDRDAPSGYLVRRGRVEALPAAPGARVTRYEALDDRGWLAGTAVVDLEGSGGGETHGFIARPVR